jgi:hypothetical protein
VTRVSEWISKLAVYMCCTLRFMYVLKICVDTCHTVNWVSYYLRKTGCYKISYAQKEDKQKHFHMG